MLLKTVRQNKEWEKLITITASYLYLDTGRRDGILNQNPPTYIPHNIWLLNLWILLPTFQGSIKLHKIIKTKLQRDGDMFIMDIAEVMKYTTKKLKKNKFRMYLHAIMVRDLATDSGTHIYSARLNGTKQCTSIFTCPFFDKPQK